MNILFVNCSILAESFSVILLFFLNLLLMLLLHLELFLFLDLHLADELGLSLCVIDPSAGTFLLFGELDKPCLEG
jgi:hypothetical protein